jgi:hypothetical protein
MKHLTTDSLLLNLCETVGDMEYAQKARFTRLLATEIREFARFVPIPRYKALVVENNMTLTLPDDCLDVFRVGYIFDGKFYNIGRDPNLIRDVCIEVGFDPSKPAHSLFYDGITNSYPTALYGLKVDPFPEGYWNYNEAENRIELSGGALIVPGSYLHVHYNQSEADDFNRPIPTEFEKYLLYKCLQAFYVASEPSKSDYFRKLAIGKRRQVVTQRQRLTLEQVIGAITEGYNSVKS